MCDVEIDLSKIQKKHPKHIVNDVNNPAYVVKEIIREKEKDGVVLGGCVVYWNEGFERITNFTPSDIDYKYCHDLFRGVRSHQLDERDEITKKKKTIWFEVCYECCEYRRVTEPRIIKDFWINCKDTRGGDTKKCVDVHIFPFDTGENKYTLHILINKPGVHSLSYFDKMVQEDKGIKVREEQQPQDKDKISNKGSWDGLKEFVEQENLKKFLAVS